MQYISNTENDRIEMLRAIGVSSFDELIAKVPRSLRDPHFDLPVGVSEMELVRELAETGRMNRHFNDHACYLGGGNYDHFIRWNSFYQFWKSPKMDSRNTKRSEQNQYPSTIIK